MNVTCEASSGEQPAGHEGRRANMLYTTELQIHVATDNTDEAFDRHTDEVLDALIDLDGVVDPDMTVNLARKEVLISITFEAKDAGEATMLAFSSVRSAIHEVGGWTPGWEDAISAAIASSAPTSDVSGSQATVSA